MLKESYECMTEKESSSAENVEINYSLISQYDKTGIMYIDMRALFRAKVVLVCACLCILCMSLTSHSQVSLAHGACYSVREIVSITNKYVTKTNVSFVTFSLYKA